MLQHRSEDGTISDVFDNKDEYLENIRNWIKLIDDSIMVFIDLKMTELNLQS